MWNRRMKPVVTLLAAGGLGAGLVAACSSPPASPGAGRDNQPAATAPSSPPHRVVHLSLTGKIDATSGKPGTYTGRPGWPALAPSDIRVPAGATVVLTIREYDDMVTPLRSMGMMGSPFNSVSGGTETVDGRPVTYVDNADIAHTITIPQLRINVPLPKAPQGGFTKVVYTFTAPGTPGIYTWQCETPCGTGPTGWGGPMATDGWMRGHFTIT